MLVCKQVRSISPKHFAWLVGSYYNSIVFSAQVPCRLTSQLRLPGLTVNDIFQACNDKDKSQKKDIESIWPKSELYLYCNHQHTHLPAVSTATGTISNPNKLCFICVRAAGKSDEEYSHVISFCSWHFEFCRQRRTRMDQCLHATWTLDSWQQRFGVGLHTAYYYTCLCESLFTSAHIDLHQTKQTIPIRHSETHCACKH